MRDRITCQRHFNEARWHLKDNAYSCDVCDGLSSLFWVIWLLLSQSCSAIISASCPFPLCISHLSHKRSVEEARFWPPLNERSSLWESSSLSILPSLNTLIIFYTVAASPLMAFILVLTAALSSFSLFLHFLPSFFVCLFFSFLSIPQLFLAIPSPPWLYQQHLTLWQAFERRQEGEREREKIPPTA